MSGIGFSYRFLPFLGTVLFAAGTVAEEGRILLVRTFPGHKGVVSEVQFSPDGTYLATAGIDGSIRLWHVDDGQLHATLDGNGGGIRSIAFGPGGDVLLAGRDDRTLKLWSIPGVKPDSFAVQGSPVRALLLCRDGRRLVSGGEDGVLRIWNRAERKEELAIEHLGAAPLALAESPDGKHLAVGLRDQTVRVYVLLPPPPPPPPSGTPAQLIGPGESWRFHKGTADPGSEWHKPGFDDSHWAVGESGFGYSSNPDELKTVKIRLDDMGNRYLSFYIRKTFQIPHPDRVEKLELQVLYDDGFVSYLNGAEVGRANVAGNPPRFDQTAQSTKEPVEATIDLTPHRSKLAAGENLLAIQGHNGSQTSSDFILTPSLQAVLKPPMTETPKQPNVGDEVLRIEKLGSPVRSVAFSPDEKQLGSACETGAIRIHSFPEGSLLGELKGPADPAGGLGFFENGKLASGDSDGKIRLWDLAQKTVQATLEGHEGPVAALSLRSDRRFLISCGADGAIRLWDPAKKSEVWTSAASGDPLLCAGFSPDGKVVTSGSAGGILRVFDSESGKLLEQFDHQKEIRTVAASSDGHQYVSGSTGEIFDWSREAGAVRKTFSAHNGIVHSIAISPDGKLAASGGADGTVRLWNLSGGNQVRSVQADATSVYRVAFNPDGKVIASGGFDRKVKLWNVSTGSSLQEFEEHLDGVLCLAFTPGGEFLLSGSSDGTIRVWNPGDGKSVRVFEGHSGWIIDLKPVPGKSQIASVDYDGNLLIWEPSTGKVILKESFPIGLHGLAVSPDGKWISTANRDGSSFLLNVSPNVK